MAIETSVIPSMLSIIPLIPIILIIIAGISPNILSGFWFLQINVVALNVPPELGNSTFLTDLSALTGTNLVGQDATITSLNLAKIFTVYLFTNCASDDTSTICTTPRLGFHFDPGKDLKLDQTSIIGPDIKNYGLTATFLGVAYIIAAMFVMFVSILDFVRGKKFPRAEIFSAVFSTLATIFLFAAAIAALVEYRKVKDIFDTSFSSFGIRTILGRKVFILSWCATVFSLTVSIYLSVRARRVFPKPSSNGNGYSNKVKGASEILVTGSGRPASLKPKKPGSMGRLPFVGSRGKYTQIEEQTKLKNRTVDYNNDWDPLVRLEEDEEFMPNEHRGIAMILLPENGKQPTRDTNDISTSYEPYRHEDETDKYAEEQPAYDPIGTS